jgi:hypothetical protein
LCVGKGLGVHSSVLKSLAKTFVQVILSANIMTQILFPEGFSLNGSFLNGSIQKRILNGFLILTHCKTGVLNGVWVMSREGILKGFLMVSFWIM